MNLVSFKERVAKVTAKAANAAKSIKNLDQMAANDEYVHSEGLNVKRKDHHAERTPRKTLQNQNTSDQMMGRRPNGTANGNGNLYSYNQETNNEHVDSAPTGRQIRVQNQIQPLGNLNSRSSSVSSSSHYQNSYMLPSVAQVMRESEIQNQRQQNEQNKVVSQDSAKQTLQMNIQDDDSVDSDEEYDPILEMIDRKRQRRRPQQDYSGHRDASIHEHSSITEPDLHVRSPHPPSSSSSNNENHFNASSPSPTRKDPNRFFADLDARMSKSNDNGENDPNDPELQVNYPSPGKDKKIPPPMKTLQSFMNSTNKMEWLRNVKESINVNVNMNGSRNPSSGDIECQPLTLPKKKQPSADDDDDVHVIQSSALLGNDEEANAELLRIRQRMNMTYYNSALDILEKNRHYGVVFLTFFMTTLFYFLTRSKTDDSVTR